MAKYAIATARKSADDLVRLVGIPSLTVLKVMLDTKTGETPVSAFKANLTAINFKRLSTHIHRLRKLVGADIVATRDGKAIASYKLVNAGVFANVTADVLVKKPKAAKPAKAPKAAKPAKTKMVTVKVGNTTAKAQKMPKPLVKAATKKAPKTVAPAAPVDVDNLPEVLPLSSASVDADFDSFDSTDLPGFLK